MLHLTLPGIITEITSRTGITRAGSTMEIPSAPILSTVLQQQLFTASATEARLNSALNTGQSIEALIIAIKIESAPSTNQPVNDQLPRSNPPAYTITLRIGNEQFEASSDRPLVPGQYIQIKPLTTQRLRVLTPPAGNPGIRSQLTQEHLIQQGLRQALPIQQAYAATIRQMAVLLQNPLAPQYQQVHHYFRQLLQTLPRPQQLQTSTGIKQAIQNSGLFLERKLHSAPAANAVSVKTPAASSASAQPASNPAADTGTGMVGHRSTASTVTPAPTGNPPLPESPAKAQATAERPLSQIGQLARQTALPQSSTSSVGKQAVSLDARIPNPRVNLIPDASTDIQQPLPLSETVRNDFKAQLLQLAGLLKSLPFDSPSRPDNTLRNPPGSQGSVNRDPLLSDLVISNALYTAKGKLTRSGGTANPATVIDGTATADTPEQKILQQLQSSLARLQLQQLNTLELQHGSQHETTAKTGFHLEIPVLASSGHLDTLHIQVEEDTPGQTAEETSYTERVWKITLSFDMEHLGLFHAQLKMIQESVSATFWAEHKETVTAIREEFSELERSLENAGIHVTQLQCHQGQPTQTSNRLQQSLIDLKT